MPTAILLRVYRQLMRAHAVKPAYFRQLMLGALMASRLAAAPDSFAQGYNFIASQKVEGAGGPPSITVQPQNATNCVGATVAFSVTAQGPTPLSYRWRSNSVAIGSATNSSYSLTNIQTSSAATY